MTDIDPAALTDEQIRAVMAEAGRRNGRIGASRRERADRICQACGVTIPDALSSRRYCSNACRVRAAYWRGRDVEQDPTAPFMANLVGRGWQEARTYRRPKRAKR